MTTKVKAGSMEDCLYHFAESHRFNITDLAQCRVRNQVCKLIGVSESTGNYWFAKFNIPIGVNALKLQLLLEVCGYEVRERQHVNPTFRALGDLIALQILTTNDAAEFIGADTDKILAIAMGREGTTDERISKVTELVELHKIEAQSKMTAFRQALQELRLISSKETPRAEVEVRTSSVTSDIDRERSIQALAHLILGIKPLADRVLSDEFTPDERQRLRELTGNGRSNAIFDLSNTLNRLCGERARSEIQPQATRKGQQ